MLAAVGRQSPREVVSWSTLSFHTRLVVSGFTERELPLDDDAQWSTSDDQSDSARRVSTWPPRVATSHTGLALNAPAMLGGRRLAPSRLKDAASAGTGSLLHPTQHAVLRQLRHLTIRLSRFPSHPQIGVGSLSSLPIS